MDWGFFSDFYFFIALLCENGNMLTWLFVNQCENGKPSVEHDLVKAHQMGCYNVSYSLVLVFSFSPHFIYLFILRNCHNWKFADLQLTALFNQWVYSVFINIWSQLTQYIDVLCKANDISTYHVCVFRFDWVLILRGVNIFSNSHSILASRL